MVVLGIDSSLSEINSCKTTKCKHAICQKYTGLDRCPMGVTNHRGRPLTTEEHPLMETCGTAFQ